MKMQARPSLRKWYSQVKPTSQPGSGCGRDRPELPATGISWEVLGLTPILDKLITLYGVQAKPSWPFGVTPNHEIPCRGGSRTAPTWTSTAKLNQRPARAGCGRRSVG